MHFVYAHSPFCYRNPGARQARIRPFPPGISVRMRSADLDNIILSADFDEMRNARGHAERARRNKFNILLTTPCRENVKD